jgi:hypothetical protein
MENRPTLGNPTGYGVYWLMVWHTRDMVGTCGLGWENIFTLWYMTYFYENGGSSRVWSSK